LLEKKLLIETAFEQSGNKLEGDSPSTDEEGEELEDQSGGFTERDDDEDEDESPTTKKSSRKSVAVPPPMGCSVTHTASSTSPAWIVLAGLGLLGAFRRRRGLSI